jgi:hypothetical protein
MRCNPALLLLPLLLAGCFGNGEKDTWTPEKRKEVARTAGIAAASGWLMIAKPDADTVVAVKIVTDKIQENLTSYQEGGFVGALPGIKEAILEALPGEENAVKRKAAENLAKLLLEELDKLFQDHPAWKELGDEVAGLVAAFCGGASEALAGLRAAEPA